MPTAFSLPSPNSRNLESEPDDHMDLESNASHGEVAQVYQGDYSQLVSPLIGDTNTGKKAVRERSSNTLGDDTASTSAPKKRKRSVQSDIGSPGHAGLSLSQISQNTSLVDDSVEATGKRRRTDPFNSTQSTTSQAVPGISVDNELYGLNLILWKRIFCFVPPVFLGRLLRVSRSFHMLLTTNSKSSDATSNGHGLVNGPSSESIWTSSRKIFAPGLPKPLKGQRDLEMWKLLRGNHCQSCGQEKTLMTGSSDRDPWQNGPGNDGVRVIWPFRIRTCGPCLDSQCEQEISLLCSSSIPSFLLQALPCIFLTQQRHIVAPTHLTTAQGSAEIQITKYFYKPHLQEIERRFNKVKELGPGSVEEWIKGLDGERKESLQDAIRWEQWEAKGGLRKVNSRPSAKASTVQKVFIGIKPRYVANQEVVSSMERSTTLQLLEKDGVAPIAKDSQAFPNTSTASPTSLPSFGQEYLPVANGIQATTQPTIRQGRNMFEANEAKAARRTEIERRCLSLDPPIPPNVLIHMESFQAALQISTPLTERAWDILKPRLLSQVTEARSRDAALAERLRANSAQFAEQGQSVLSREEQLDPSDREWELAQAPIQEYLSSCAEDLILEHWGSEAAITLESASKFAADILLSSRARFYEEKSRHSERTGPPSPNQSYPWHHKLTLENMKWLYDQKIKSVAERFQKELFLCNGCEVNSRYYGFEAVIQHYAAKHTTLLSLGNVVVNWRSEWPEDAPFHPNPPTNRITMHPSSTPWTPNSNFQTGSYGKRAVSSPMPTQQMNYQPQYSVAGALNHSAYTVPPPNIAPGSFLPSQNQPNEGINVYEPYSAHAYHVGQNFYAQQLPQYPSHLMDQNLSYAPSAIAPQPPAATFPFTATDVPMINVANSFMTPLVTPDLYQTQLNDMAKHARDVWFGTSGIKDISQSVRIYVVIQHVVSRFEKKYTNEPSLSMFIDGLNRCPSMRPVRSLNGLACKTCVEFPHVETDSVGRRTGTASETKFYTLPHLLNHFHTAHLEKSRPSVDLQTGIESSRLDWKFDMIELPGDNVITGLVNASGIDDKKFGLIASVFPRLFSGPLPKLGSGNVPKSFSRPANGKRNFNLETLGTAPTRTVDLREDRPKEAMDNTNSTGVSPRTSEAPGEDEYDPHRPAYLGRIVESHQLNRPSIQERSSDTFHGSQYHDSENRERKTWISEGIARSSGTGAFSDQLLRHHGRATRHDDLHNRSLSRGSKIHDNAHVSTFDVTQRPAFARQADRYPIAERSGLAAADKFLDEFDSGMETRDRTRVVDYAQSASSIKAFASAPNSIHQEYKNHASLVHENASRTTQDQDHRSAARYAEIHHSDTNGRFSAGVHSHNGVHVSHPECVNDIHPSQQTSSRRFVDDSNGHSETRNDSKVLDHVPTVTRRESDDLASLAAFRSSSPSLPTGRNVILYERSRADTRYPSSYLRDDVSSGRMEYICSSTDHPSYSYPNTIREQRIEYVPLEPREANALPYMRTASPDSGTAIAHNYYDRPSRAERYPPSDERLYYRAGQTAWTPIRNYGYIEEHV